MSRFLLKWFYLSAVATVTTLEGFALRFGSFRCAAVANHDMTCVAAVSFIVINAVFNLTGDSFNFVHRFHSLHLGKAN